MSAYIKRGRVLEILRELGGCGAKPDTFEDGWDKAINEVYYRIEKESPVEAKYTLRAYDEHDNLCGNEYHSDNVDEVLSIGKKLFSINRLALYCKDLEPFNPINIVKD